MESKLEHALAVPGTLLLTACVLARFVAPLIRGTFRPVVLQIVHKQCDSVARLQQLLRNPLLDILVKITALTVTVEFYLLSIPTIVWLAGPSGPAAGMAICQCMAVSTYMTCVLKDMLSCPRPGQTSGAAAKRAKDKAAALAAAGKAEPLPPALGAGVTAGVEVLEEAYRGEIEMGAPSMHTWCGFIMPAYSVAVAQQLGVLDATRAGVLTVCAACWACWVALSRLYLGVHTPVDLALGAAGGVSVLGLWRSVGLAQVAAVGSAEAAALGGLGGLAAAVEPGVALAAMGCVYVLALATYPRPLSHTTSYEYAVIFLGAAFGGLAGFHLPCSLAVPLLQRLLGSPSPVRAAAVAAAVPALLRHPVVVLLLGFLFVAAVKELSKAALSALLPVLLGLAPASVRRMWQPPVHPAGCWWKDAAAAAGTIGKEAAAGVLMKTPRLAYDVDFVRKFVNYGITVYAVMEYRHLAGLLLISRRGGL